MQQFQILTKHEKIVAIRPYNPFAQGIVESINAHPIEEQAQLLNIALSVSGVTGKLEILVWKNIEAINSEHNIVIYLLTVFK
jgi:hypothetical protein